MRPPAATRSIVCSIAGGAPVASITTGMPSPSVSSSTRSSRPGAAGDRHGAELGRGGEPLGREIGGIDLRALRARATSTIASPIGPAPSTSTVSSAVTMPRRQPCTPIATGSANAASKSVSVVRHGVQIAGRRRDEVGEAALAVHADDGQVGAAIALADPAGIAVAAADERVDHDAACPAAGPLAPAP